MEAAKLDFCANDCEAFRRAITSGETSVVRWFWERRAELPSVREVFLEMWPRVADTNVSELDRAWLEAARATALAEQAQRAQRAQRAPPRRNVIPRGSLCLMHMTSEL